jgi:hypothetical protein
MQHVSSPLRWRTPQRSNTEPILRLRSAAISCQIRACLV